jgi:hypothetical protein
VHGWLELSIIDYIKFILDFGKLESVFLIESHSGIDDSSSLKSAVESLERDNIIKCIQIGFSDDDLGSIRDHYYFKKVKTKAF